MTLGPLHTWAKCRDLVMVRTLYVLRIAEHIGKILVERQKVSWLWVGALLKVLKVYMGEAAWPAKPPEAKLTASIGIGPMWGIVA